MSKEFEDLMRRATCQMKVMLRERRRFKVLAKELEVFTRKERKVEENNRYNGSNSGSGNDCFGLYL